MRIVLALVLMLTGMPALAQDLTVRLITPLEPMPGGMVELYGPLGSPVTASHGILPTLESYPINFRSGPLAEIRATTGAGAMQITIPDQALPLVMQSWGQLICPGGRPCLLLPTDPLGESFQLNSFSIALNAPVPDPEGSCLIVSGTVTSPVTAERPPGYAGTLTLQPLIPPPGEPLVPGTPVPAPVAETYQRPVTQTAHFMPPGSVDLEICGDVPDARVGRLAYTVREAGNGWSWDASGEWIITIQDNGYHGSGHAAQARHVGGENGHDGYLIQVVPGSIGTVSMDVTPIWDSLEESLYQQDPTHNPPPGAEAYEVSFTPDRNLAAKTVLVFSEPSGLPHATGQNNSLEVNAPAVLALSYFMREYLSGSSSARLPVTDAAGEDHSPVMHGGGGSALELSLEFRWTLETED